MPPFPLSFTLAFFEKKRLNLTGGGDISKHALGVTFLFGVDSLLSQVALPEKDHTDIV